MRKSNFEMIMNNLYKIEIELFKLANPPKYAIGQEVIVMDYGIKKKKITDIQVMGLHEPAWFYSFGVAQDWTREDQLYLISEIDVN